LEAYQSLKAEKMEIEDQLSKKIMSLEKDKEDAKSQINQLVANLSEF
jgi:hypothetical protein